MTPLDDLFSTDESRAESQFEKVVTLNPAEISDFPNHPFKVKQDDAMAEMVESVRKYGVLVPALVRPKENGGYEMVAGHRRKFAAALAELTEIPCMESQTAYKLLFADYPDVVNVEQMREMLGGICDKTAYRLFAVWGN